MGLMLDQLHDASRAGSVPGLWTGEVKADVRLLKWMSRSLIALVLSVFALQWQIPLRLPS